MSWPRYPIVEYRLRDEQIDALLVRILNIDGPYQRAALGTELTLLTR